MKAPTLKELHLKLNWSKMGKYPKFAIWAYDKDGNLAETGNTSDLSYIVQDAKTLNKTYPRVEIMMHASHKASPVTILETHKRREFK